MSHPYAGLSPDLILDAIEAAGFEPDGGMLALNSYENRVLQIGIDEQPPLIAKFYRPERWSDAAIIEEHQFTLELAEAEIPVVAPLLNAAGETLFFHQGFRFALFPRQGGRAPELDDMDNLAWIGRFLGRIHQQGSATEFQQRPSISAEIMGQQSIDYLLASPLFPQEQKSRYQAICKELMTGINRKLEANPAQWIRLHGDCHPGNILWTEHGPHFVDMDDCRMGPAIQDMWMLLSGSHQEMSLQLSALMEGYEMFAHFNPRELELIEPLRTLRIIHYTAWLARRWDDPAFPTAFPWFGTPEYWYDHLLTLEEQIKSLDQDPLIIY